MMLTPEQISEDIKALWTHLERLRINEDARLIATTKSQHDAVFHKPKPFEFAKLEHWKPSKHAKR